jgi:hypothetical protein
MPTATLGTLQCSREISRILVRSGHPQPAPAVCSTPCHLQAAGRADPDQEAREAVAAELSRWAQEEAQRREAVKKQALAYAIGGVGGQVW